MPGLCLHHELAFRLRECRQFQQHAPFPWQEPALWQAFLEGSAGPDMGYFPGGIPLISDLAHYYRSGQLCCALVALAKSDAERAYAWGWAAHCVADQILHPLINRGVGALLKDDPRAEIPFADHPAAHVQVELGLDAWWVAEAPRLNRLGTKQIGARPAGDVSAIAAAYTRIYGGLDFCGPLAQSRRAAGRWTGAWIKLAQLHAARHGWQSPGRLRKAFARIALLSGRCFTLTVPSRAALRGLFRAVPPEDWLIGDCHHLMRNFQQQYLLHLSSGIADLADYNLDTGLAEASPTTYLPALRTRQQLQRLLNGERRAALRSE